MSILRHRTWTEKKHLFLAVATIILVVTAVFRLVNLQDLPPGLARDETLNADIASFILQGRHALFFREGYGHEPLYHYLGAVAQSLFGDNYLAIRLPSVYLGLLLVAAVMTFVRRLCRKPGSLLVASLAGLFLAVSWWPIIFSRVGLRPILEPLLLVGAFYFWERRPYLAGLLLGLATYSYTAARVVLVIPLLMLVYLLLLRNSLKVGRERLKAAVIIGVVTLIVYAPLGLTLRADPTLQERVNQLDGPLEAARSGDFTPIIQSTIATLGVFTFTGDPLSSYTLPGVPLFGLLMGVLFYGGLLLCLSRIGQDARYGLLLIWLGTTLLPSAAAPDAPSLIRLIGAMPVVYLLPALAVGWLYGWIVGRFEDAGRQWAGFSPVAIGSAVFLVILLAVNLWPTVNNDFEQWAALTDTREKYQSVWLDISRHWRDEGEETVQSLVVADSWYEPVKADSLRRDYGDVLASRWVRQGRAVIFPAEQSAYLYVPEFAAPLPLLFEKAGLGAPVYRSETYPSFAVYPLHGLESPLENQTAENFMIPETAETGLILLGWETQWTAETAELNLLTYWQVESGLPQDTTIFVHLQDDQGQTLAQSDTLDAAPLTMQPGDQFLELQTIKVEDLSASGSWVLGLYDLQSGLRWQRGGGEPADAVMLLSDWQAAE
ncbi:MAG: glycosyltransferase family 39 protein [Candidatus Promineifilaceae bacterium]